MTPGKNETGRTRHVFHTAEKFPNANLSCQFRQLAAIRIGVSASTASSIAISFLILRFLFRSAFDLNASNPRIWPHVFRRVTRRDVNELR